MNQLLSSFTKENIQELEQALLKLWGLVRESKIDESGEECYILVIAESTETTAELYNDVEYRWIGSNKDHIQFEMISLRRTRVDTRYEFLADKTCGGITIWFFDKHGKGEPIYQKNKLLVTV